MGRWHFALVRELPVCWLPESILRKASTLSLRIASTIEEFGVKVYQKKLEAFSTLKCVKIEKDLNRSQHREVENCKYIEIVVLWKFESE